MTSSTQILTAKQLKSLNSFEKSIPRSQVVRIIDGDELKKTTMSPIIAAIASRPLEKIAKHKPEHQKNFKTFVFGN